VRTGRQFYLELPRDIADPRVGWAYLHAAEVRRQVPAARGMDAAADALAALQNPHLEALRRQDQRGIETREAGADDGDVAFLGVARLGNDLRNACNGNRTDKRSAR
jgi:hypothetical protein